MPQPDFCLYCLRIHRIIIRVSKNGEGRGPMKKNAGMLILFILLGWLTGTWIAKLLLPVKSLSFLTSSTMLEWSPAANLDIINYDINIEFKFCLLSLIGIITAVWLYRRL